MLTGRGRLALALGVGLYVAAWAFGSDALYPVAVGLVLAAGAARVWIQLVGRPRPQRTSWGGSERVEGEDVSVDLDLVYDGLLPPAGVTIVERVARLGEFEVDLYRRPGRRLGGRYVIERAPRGRYQVEETIVTLEDPFGLARTEVRTESPGVLLVYPRLARLERLFTETGAHRLDGRRLLLRRPTGFDLHSVREYEEGESLRKVHWRSTARRGQLMVKELEDAPRDEVAVLLDASAGAVVGAPPDSSFDVQVRAAGSILLAHAQRGRRAVLVVNAPEREARGVGAEDGDFRAALELLAAVEPHGRTPASALLAGEGPAARARELTVVTAALTPDFVDRLAQRAHAGRGVSVVYVDATSFNGLAPAPEPALLRLQAAGVAVAVLRRGDDLRAALSGGPLREAAAGD